MLHAVSAPPTTTFQAPDRLVLVCRNESVDWRCLPDFDLSAVIGQLDGTPVRI
ncbi:hypothetical protein [Streptomyces sp. CC53]|uniref:hypothetical protein n=1 Tax=Streptomyces sp. CC53 TaxID=1906740 RepID=UPI0015A589FB|nr:hypothetical protein [Streptomyces sp. CC53]